MIKKYCYHIEVFYDNYWHFLQKFDDLERANYWLKLYKENYDSSHYRLIQLMEVI